MARRKDTKLVPVALELHAPQGDPDTGKVSQDVTTVYTRKDPAGVCAGLTGLHL